MRVEGRGSRVEVVGGTHTQARAHTEAPDPSCRGHTHASTHTYTEAPHPNAEFKSPVKSTGQIHRSKAPARLRSRQVTPGLAPPASGDSRTRTLALACAHDTQESRGLARRLAQSHTGTRTLALAHSHSHIRTRTETRALARAHKRILLGPLVRLCVPTP